MSRSSNSHITVLLLLVLILTFSLTHIYALDSDVRAAAASNGHRSGGHYDEDVGKTTENEQNVSVWSLINKVGQRVRRGIPRGSCQSQVGETKACHLAAIAHIWPKLRLVYPSDVCFVSKMICYTHDDSLLHDDVAHKVTSENIVSASHGQRQEFELDLSQFSLHDKSHVDSAYLIINIHSSSSGDTVVPRLTVNVINSQLSNERIFTTSMHMDRFNAGLPRCVAVDIKHWLQDQMSTGVNRLTVTVVCASENCSSTALVDPPFLWIDAMGSCRRQVFGSMSSSQLSSLLPGRRSLGQ